jgi:transposase-like protein
MTCTGAPFVPPHCPRTDCRHHVCVDGWRWVRYGSYSRRASPRRVERFRCDTCRRTFSTQSFSLEYWLKRPDVLRALAHGVLACSGYRQLARERRCSPSTIEGQMRRLGRHALLLLERHRPTGPVTEPLVVDGFESFGYSQYHPLYLNLVVGAESHFVYAFTHSMLRRKGAMTAGQRRRRAAMEAEDGRPDPRAIEHGTHEALRLAVRVPQGLVVRSDEHQAYPRALRRLEGYRVRHERTSSREARTTGNPLFPVNRLDLLLRHNSANHKRETIAFSKRHQSVVERAAWLVAWLNLVKPYSERRGGGTPAVRVGAARRRWTVGELLRWRLFPGRIVLPGTLAGYYRGEVRTPRVRNERRHVLKLAV